ncbi:hypothetical protein AEAC466_09450 [Asticcacaulis sp. AC466]|uniref:hypothetical protein n=1 Tax=Asticcacaulis sp. AC466 TaxID=1282362 RepID=UPI0003C3B3E7|nr:hypothetical protein [Asticcacaulis sp. AC466]ESQ84567.1 hypothetical protein AEAC466_09450 [Asticcacaulis sp. AC466]
MAFKIPAKGENKGLTRSKPLQSNKPLTAKKPMQAGSGFAAKAMSPADQMKAQKKALQAATIRLLEKARRDAAEQGVDLSEWENAFIEDVGERVKTYGRAFADPDKGALNGTLSMRQGQKLKEIRKKVKTKGNARGSDEQDT